MTIRGISLALRESEVLHFLGYPDSRQPSARIAELLEQVLGEARELAEGRGVFRRLPLEEAASVGLEPVEAEELVVGLVTVGSALEQRASEHLAAGALTRGLMLDAAGSAAVEEAADRLGAEIAGGETAGAVTCRLSPGYGRWGLDAQPALFARLPHQDLGVSLSEELVMRPHKSISFAMWLGATGPLPTGVAGCARCSLATCRTRRSPRRTS